MDRVPADIVNEIAPGGRLCAAINSANPVLVQTDPATGAPSGVTMDLARELARRLGVPLAPVVIDGAGKSFEAVKAAACDIGFLAIEPARAAEIDFTAPYVIIEGVYAVRADCRSRPTPMSTAPACASRSTRAPPTTCFSRARSSMRRWCGPRRRSRCLRATSSKWWPA